jgi:hypothetical protein
MILTFGCAIISPPCCRSSGRQMGLCAPAFFGGWVASGGVLLRFFGRGGSSARSRGPNGSETVLPFGCGTCFRGQFGVYACRLGDEVALGSHLNHPGAWNLGSQRFLRSQRSLQSPACRRFRGFFLGLMSQGLVPTLRLWGVQREHFGRVVSGSPHTNLRSQCRKSYERLRCETKPQLGWRSKPLRV